MKYVRGASSRRQKRRLGELLEQSRYKKGVVLESVAAPKALAGRLF